MPETNSSGYLQDSYGTKGGDYFTSARYDIVARLPDGGGLRVIELGCGNGATGRLAIQQGKAAEYVGVEMFEPMAREASRHLTRVHVGDVAMITIPEEPGSFDVLVCSEVIEHLVDPAPVLVKLVRLLKPGGLVFASSPNVMHYRIISQLLRGRFEYEDAGAMDRTHLRWFTPESYRRLFEEAGVEVTGLERLASHRSWRVRLAELLPSPVRYLLWYQINLQGRKRGI